MPELEVRACELVMRTMKVTRGLLKQLTVLDRMPTEWMDEAGKVKSDQVVAWFKGTVLGDEFVNYTILRGNVAGTFFLWPHKIDGAKHIYI